MLFFGPEEEARADRMARERKAKLICAGCPLQRECLDEALRHPVKHGVWGGLNSEERALERRRLRRAAAGERPWPVIRVGPARPGPARPGSALAARHARSS